MGRKRNVSMGGCCWGKRLKRGSRGYGTITQGREGKLLSRGFATARRVIVRETLTDVRLGGRMPLTYGAP